MAFRDAGLRARGVGAVKPKMAFPVAILRTVLARSKMVVVVPMAMPMGMQMMLPMATLIWLSRVWVWVMVATMVVDYMLSKYQLQRCQKPWTWPSASALPMIFKDGFQDVSS